MGFVATLKRSWPVLLSYAIFSVWGVGCFLLSLALTHGGFGVGAGEFPVVIGLLVSTAIGHLAGNALGLARFRMMVIVILFTGLFIAFTMSGVVIGIGALFLVLALFAALGG